jgi:tripartite-type tricarboxylate transporter receptor subunit TctC
LRTAIPIAMAVTLLAGGPARAGVVADFYRDKTLTMIVGSDPGGGYDVYARLLARYLGKYIPGKPAIVVQNRSGAASIQATNYVYEVAPQDGTVVLAPNRTAAFAQLLGQYGTRYQAARLNWLGSLNNEVGVIEVASSAPVKTLADARKVALTLGSTTVGSDGDVYPTLMNMTLGTKFHIVRGYSGSAAIDLAIARGEVQAQSDSFSSVIKRYPDWRSKISLIVQLALSPHPDLSDVPLVLDAIRADDIVSGLSLDEATAAWRIMLLQKAMGRPFAAGPNVPADRVAALRQAFKAALADPELRAEAARGRNEINPVDGGEIQGMLAQVGAAEPGVLELLRTATTFAGENAVGGR